MIIDRVTTALARALAEAEGVIARMLQMRWRQARRAPGAWAGSWGDPIPIHARPRLSTRAAAAGLRSQGR